MNVVRVLHVIKSLGRGGAEMLLPETLQLHDKASFEFHYIYFLPWKDQMVASIRRHGGRVTCLEANNNFQLMGKAMALVRYIKTNNIDVIHAHLPWAGILCRVVGKICNVPVIYTEHNKQQRYHPGTRLMNLLTLNMLSLIIAVSDDVALSIHEHKRKLRTPVRIILNGVNTDHFNKKHFDRQIIRKQLGINENVIVIGTVAVFRTQKRLETWIEIACRILDKNPDVCFIIVGDGPLKETLLKKRRSLGLEDKVHMPGLQTEIRPYLSTFDIYMMTSIFEGLPLALLEAMSMQCPVIATGAGGIKEVIRHEKDGLHCSVDSPETLTGYATLLIQDSILRTAYGDQGRERILSTFDMRTMVHRLEDVYREIGPFSRQ